MDELVRVGTCLVCDWIHGINCYGLCNSIYIVTVRVQSFSGRILRMLCARVKSNRYSMVDWYSSRAYDYTP